MNLKETSMSSAIVSKLRVLGIRELEQLPYFLRETPALRKLALVLNMSPDVLRDRLKSIVDSHPDVTYPPIGSKRFSARGLHVPERRKAGMDY